ncbi:MAG: hypothetical protein LBU14_05925 [Candidatus Peribacteria bacterium]|nr:hypothetical protein [Candidatus Peribacteria bacterium]
MFFSHGITRNSFISNAVILSLTTSLASINQKLSNCSFVNSGPIKFVLDNQGHKHCIFMYGAISSRVLSNP